MVHTSITIVKLKMAVQMTMKNDCFTNLLFYVTNEIRLLCVSNSYYYSLHRILVECSILQAQPVCYDELIVGVNTKASLQVYTVIENIKKI